MINATVSLPKESLSAEDLSRYERVWNRVAPNLTPYERSTERKNEAVSVFAPGMPDNSLPGDISDSCCMGTAAMGLTDVIEGYITDELSDAAFYRSFLRCAKSKHAMRVIQDICADETMHAKKLMAAYYLITGKLFCPVIDTNITVPCWRDGLRMRYHAEACGGYNYMRSADETTDPCLTELLQDLSADEYRHAAAILDLLACMF